MKRLIPWAGAAAMLALTIFLCGCEKSDDQNGDLRVVGKWLRTERSENLTPIPLTARTLWSFQENGDFIESTTALQYAPGSKDPEPTKGTWTSDGTYIVVTLSNGDRRMVYNIFGNALSVRYDVGAVDVRETYVRQ